MALPYAWPPLAVAESWAAAGGESNGSSGLPALAIPPATLAPAWQLLVAGDGSPTRLLSILTQSNTTVTLLDEVALGALPGAGDAPPEVGSLQPPLLRRRIVMHAGNAQPSNDGAAQQQPPLMYAVSWWNAGDYARHMPVASQPIGRSLASGRLELHRELHAVYRGTAGPALAAVFGLSDDRVGRKPAGGLDSPGNADAGVASSQLPGDAWGRHYTMFHGGRPLSVICEVFSPALERFLGPQRPGRALGAASSGASDVELEAAAEVAFELVKATHAHAHSSAPAARGDSSGSVEPAAQSDGCDPVR